VSTVDHRERSGFARGRIKAFLRRNLFTVALENGHEVVAVMPSRFFCHVTEDSIGHRGRYLTVKLELRSVPRTHRIVEVGGGALCGAGY
jgi:hypothetical protein